MPYKHLLIASFFLALGTLARAEPALAASGCVGPDGGACEPCGLGFFCWPGQICGKDGLCWQECANHDQCPNPPKSICWSEGGVCTNCPAGTRCDDPFGLACNEQRDCLGRATCRNGVCAGAIEGVCWADDDCPNPKVCKRRPDQYYSTCQGECRDDTDCAYLELCRDDECVAVECKSRTDCSPRQICSSHSCETVGCTAHNHCRLHEACSGANGGWECTAVCQPGEFQVAGGGCTECAQNSWIRKCDTDAQCNAGEKCALPVRGETSSELADPSVSPNLSPRGKGGKGQTKKQRQETIPFQAPEDPRETSKQDEIAAGAGYCIACGKAPTEAPPDPSEQPPLSGDLVLPGATAPPALPDLWVSSVRVQGEPRVGNCNTVDVTVEVDQQGTVARTFDLGLQVVTSSGKNVTSKTYEQRVTASGRKLVTFQNVTLSGSHVLHGIVDLKREIDETNEENAMSNQAGSVPVAAKATCEGQRLL